MWLDSVIAATANARTPPQCRPGTRSPNSGAARGFDPHVVDTFHTVMARRSQAPNAAASAPALAQMQR
jgi:hypothetical protein